MPKYHVSEVPTPYSKPNKPRILGPADAADLCQVMKSYRQEVFRVLILNTAHYLLRKVTVSKGAINMAVIHPREVFSRAVALQAASIVLVHNHPSGDPEPSQDDISLSQRMEQAGALLGIEVLDHIIVSQGGFYSLRERGQF